MFFIKLFGKRNLAVLLLVFLAIIPLAFAAEPSIDFSLSEQNSQIAFDYSLSRTDSSIQCLKLELYQNSVPLDVQIANDCSTSGTKVFPKQEANEFYAVIKYFDGSSIKTFTSPAKSLQQSGEQTPTAHNLRFVRNNIPLNAISEGASFLVSLKFDLSNKDNVESITADLSGLTTNPAKKQQYKSITIDPASCVSQQEKFSCAIPDIQLQPAQATVSITLEIENSEGNSSNQTLSKTFTISNSNPEISFFGSDKCSQEGKCFIKDGINNILLQFTGSSAGFSTRQVYYSAGAQASRASECSNSECYGGLFVECNDGPVNIFITSSGSSPSQDDAGNLLAGKTSATLYCDNTNPEIAEFSAASSTGLNFTKSGDKIIVTAQVREETKPLIVVNFSDFGEGLVEGTCTEKEIYWECSASATAKPGPYTGTLTAVVSDIVGNTAAAQAEIDVLAVDTNQSPDLWRIGKAIYSPDVFNKKFIPQSDNNIYIYLKLEPKKKSAESLLVVPKGCIAEQGYGVDGLIQTEGDNALLTKQRGATNIVLNLNLRKSQSDYNNYDELRFTCSIDVYSKWGDVFFSKPEQENYSITIKLLDTDDVGVNVQNEIDSVKEGVEQERKDWQQISTFVSYMDPVCRQVLPFFSKTSQALDSAAVTLEGIPGAQGAAQGVSNAATRVNDVHGEAKAAPAIGQVCRFITCDTAVNKAIPSLMGDLPGVGTMTKLAGYNNANYEDIFDPYKSIYLAYMSACLPAVVDLQERHRAVNCEYIRCLSEDVSAGYPISSCQSAKSYSTCKYYTGEIFELIPYTALQRRLGDKVKAILSNPASIAGMGLSNLLCKKVHSPIAHAACSIPENIKEIKTYVDMYTKWPAPSSSTTDSYCSQIMGKVDDDGYWKPFNSLGEPFYTDRFYPDIVGPLPQEEKRTGCTEYGCTFVDDQGRQNSEFIVVTYPSGIQRVFYKGEYVGRITTTASQIPNFSPLQGLSQDLEAEIYEKAATGDLIDLSQVSQEYYEEINGPDGVYRTVVGGVAGPHEQNLAELESRLVLLQDAKQAYETQKNIVLGIDQQKEQLKELEKQISQTSDTEQLIELNEEKEFIQGYLDRNENQARKDLKDAEKEYSKQQDRYKDQLNTIARDAKYEEYNRQWEGGWNAWSKMLENAMAVDYVTRYIPGFSEWVNKWWINNWLKTFFEGDVVQVAFGDYEGLICESSLEKSSQQGQALISTGLLYRPAIHIEAEKTSLIDPNPSKPDDEYYNYFVSAGINAKKGGLKFKIFAYGDNTINLTSDEILPDDNPRYPSEQGMITFSSPKQYSRVCMVFDHSKGELFDYFDKVELDDSKVCNTIVRQ